MVTCDRAVCPADACSSAEVVSAPRLLDGRKRDSEAVLRASKNARPDDVCDMEPSDVQASRSIRRAAPASRPSAARPSSASAGGRRAAAPPHSNARTPGPTVRPGRKPLRGFSLLEGWLPRLSSRQHRTAAVLIMTAQSARPPCSCIAGLDAVWLHSACRPRAARQSRWRPLRHAFAERLHSCLGVKHLVYSILTRVWLCCSRAEQQLRHAAA